MARLSSRNGFCVLLCASLLQGCANQLPQRSEHESRAERQLLEHKLKIDADEKQPLELPQRRIRIYEQKTFAVTEYDVTRRYDRYTPYQPWRELYEVPLGAVAVVAGVGANVVNVVALGNVPESATRGWIEYGMAGLNPAMNTQSNGRAEQNLASLVEDQRDKRIEHSNLPWVERNVLVEVGEQSFELSTDRKGYLYLNLLDGPLAEQDMSKVSQVSLIIEDPLDGIRNEIILKISPALRGKLQEAHTLIFSDLQDDDVDQWVYRVKRLSDLGFEDEASDLEQSLIELTRNDPELQQEFLKALQEDGGRLVADPGEQP